MRTGAGRLAAAVLAGCLGSLASAVPASEPAPALGDLAEPVPSRIERHSIDSPRLGRPLDYAVYLPPGFDPARRYNTIYLLHGLDGNRDDWIHAGNLAPTADRLIEGGGTDPFIVVLPSAGNGWYVDNPDEGEHSVGPIFSAIVDELIPHAEAAHAGRGERAGRTVAGLSMGGYGAFRFAAYRPDLFVAAFALSPAIFPDPPPGEPYAVSERQIGMFRGAYGVPFDRDRMHATNIYRRLPALAAMLHPPRFWIMIGDDDYFELWYESILMFKALRDHRIPAEMRLTDGTHNWPYWSDHLPEALRTLDREMRNPPKAADRPN